MQALNSELVRARAELEERVAERTDALRTSQARVIQQEKMAAFGLLAAGIAHEVGNPLAALSSLVQMLKRRGPDPYTSEKLDLAGRQLHRIERTIRELIDFSRPASRAVTRTRIGEVVDEALGIAKYYQRTKQRVISTDIPAEPAAGAGGSRPPDPGDPQPGPQRHRRDRRPGPDPPPGPGRGRRGWMLSVEDDGRGISLADRCRLFQPFFTTKPHGTGLGLFVSRQILEEFAGTLTYPFRAGPGLDVHDPASLRGDVGRATCQRSAARLGEQIRRPAESSPKLRRSAAAGLPHVNRGIEEAPMSWSSDARERADVQDRRPPELAGPGPDRR